MSDSLAMTTDCQRPAAYRWLVRISIGLGLVTCAGGALWLIAGAGIFGSPVAGAFEVDKLTGYANYWPYWMLWVVVAGPIALLPCALLERWLPPVGALAMIVASFFVAEAGIRASRMFWGFSTADAQIVIGCISTPILILGVSLLVLGARRNRLTAVVISLLVLCAFAYAASLRYDAVKKYWNANCPGKLQQL